MNTTRRAVAFAAAIGCTVSPVSLVRSLRIIHRIPSPWSCLSPRAVRLTRSGGF